MDINSYAKEKFYGTALYDQGGKSTLEFFSKLKHKDIFKISSYLSARERKNVLEIGNNHYKIIKMIDYDNKYIIYKNSNIKKIKPVLFDPKMLVT